MGVPKRYKILLKNAQQVYVLVNLGAEHLQLYCRTPF